MDSPTSPERKKGSFEVDDKPSPIPFSEAVPKKSLVIKAKESCDNLIAGFSKKGKTNFTAAEEVVSPS
ncbi:hypothetical protein HDV05_002944, partial [Chytridiales sp. JEL 0842]